MTLYFSHHLRSVAARNKIAFADKLDVFHLKVTEHAYQLFSDGPNPILSGWIEGTGPYEGLEIAKLIGIPSEDCDFFSYWFSMIVAYRRETGPAPALNCVVF